MRYHHVLILPGDSPERRYWGQTQWVCKRRHRSHTPSGTHSTWKPACTRQWGTASLWEKHGCYTYDACMMIYIYTYIHTYIDIDITPSIIIYNVSIFFILTHHISESQLQTPWIFQHGRCVKKHQVFWHVDASKLKGLLATKSGCPWTWSKPVTTDKIWGQERQTVSPSFELPFEGHWTLPVFRRCFCFLGGIGQECHQNPFFNKKDRRTGEFQVSQLQFNTHQIPISFHGWNVPECWD